MDIAIIGLMALVVILSFVLAAYPGRVARRRGHASHRAIDLCGLLGWLIWPLWVIAWIWAYTGPEGEPVRSRKHRRSPRRPAGYGGPVTEPEDPPTDSELAATIKSGASVGPRAEVCANCGRMIGRLETPHLWQGRIVCSGCRQILETTF